MIKSSVLGAPYPTSHYLSSTAYPSQLLLMTTEPVEFFNIHIRERTFCSCLSVSICSFTVMSAIPHILLQMTAWHFAIHLSFFLLRFSFETESYWCSLDWPQDISLPAHASWVIGIHCCVVFSIHLLFHCILFHSFYALSIFRFHCLNTVTSSAIAKSIQVMSFPLDVCPEWQDHVTDISVQSVLSLFSKVDAYLICPLNTCARVLSVLQRHRYFLFLIILMTII